VEPSVLDSSSAHQVWTGLTNRSWGYSKRNGLEYS
jgi:hypothetical protein